MTSFVRTALHRTLYASVMFILVLLAGTASAQPCIYVGDLNFGTLRPDSIATKQLTICNTGRDTIAFVSPNPKGDSVISWLLKNFSISNADKNLLRTTVLGPKGSTDPERPECITINVTFSSPTTGFFRATARLWASTRDCRDTSIWTANVSAPGPQLTDYDWKERWITSQNSCTKNSADSYAGQVIASNEGTSPYRVQSIAIMGNDAQYSKLDSSNVATTITEGLEIKPGQGQEKIQKVLFMPQEERIYIARVKVITQYGDTVYSILKGIGTESHIGLSGYNFGMVGFDGPGSTTVPGTVTLTTKPTRPTTITGIAINGSEAGEFSFDWANATAPYNYAPTDANPWQGIPPNTAIGIPVNFTPSSASEQAKTAVIDITGDFSACDTSFAVITGTASASLSVDVAVADQFTVSVDRSGTLVLSLPHTAEIILDIHDPSGRYVGRLVDGRMEAGTHSIQIDRNGVVSGLYIYRLDIDGKVQTGTIALVR